LILGAKKPKQFRYTKHNGGPGRKPGKVASIEPDDSEYVFQKLSVKHADGNWYGRASDGKIYRYSVDKNGDAHWNGFYGKGHGSSRKSDFLAEIFNTFGINPKGN
jgi:hypothetical protein